MSMSKQCKIANENARFAPALTIIGHAIMVVALLLLLFFPLFGLFWFAVSMVIGGIITVVGLYLLVVERRACGLA